MFRPRGPLVDPGTNQFDLFCGKLTTRVGRGHSLVGIFAGHPVQCFTRLGVASHERSVAASIGEGVCLKIKPQVGLAGAFVGSMTLEACVGQQRTNIAAEVKVLRIHPCWPTGTVAKQGEPYYGTEAEPMHNVIHLR